MTYKIIDNFLEKEKFKELQEIVMNSNFPWFFQKTVNDNHKKEDNTCYFTHAAFKKNEKSHICNYILDLFDNKIKAKSYIRIKFNCYPKTNILEIHEPHIDYPYKHKGAIFYINSNDGFTILEKNIKVNSIENRMLFFEANKFHSSTSCTNVKARFNINFNYF
jgi:hypothetical protein